MVNLLNGIPMRNLGVSEMKEPMLAGKITEETIRDLKYPGLCSYKLDGIRCLVIDGHAVSRNLKKIPNHYIRETIEKEGLEGFDGEIITGKNFQDVSSGVMSREGTPDFYYMVFDYVIDPNEPYYLRMKRLREVPETEHIRHLLPVEVRNEKELLTFEQDSLSKGYEGVMWRSPLGLYKFGRSTFNQQWLLKLKRFDDAEAKVIDFEEEYSIEGNPKNTLGAIVVQDLKSGIKFNVGSGFDNDLRNKIWNAKQSYLGKIVTYKSQLLGTKEAPRFPTFVGFRDERDMDAQLRSE